MVMVRNKNKNFNLKKLDQKGQSTVEYLLLIAVIISLISTVFKSQAFRNIFGEEGTFAAEFRKEIEFSYRHGLRGRQFLPETINYNDRHDTYLETSGTLTRFFGAKDEYPKK